MNKTLIVAIAVFPLMLSACTKSHEEGDDGFEMSIDLSDDDDSKADKIKIGGEGEDSKFSIKAEGFSMDVDLPSITLDSDDFDLNNVSLYPGTKVTNFNIEDQKGDGGKVIIGFIAPAEVNKLSQWFETKMSDEKFEIKKDGYNLTGKTEEGDPFSLMLSEKSATETSGTLEFSETM